MQHQLPVIILFYYRRASCLAANKNRQSPVYNDDLIVLSAEISLQHNLILLIASSCVINTNSQRQAH